MKVGEIGGQDVSLKEQDIAYKWNVLIEQGYRDMCDYIYQYSYPIALSRFHFVCFSFGFL